MVLDMEAPFAEFETNRLEVSRDDRRGSAQANQAGVGRREAARREVERTEVWIEVDMQPLAAGGAGLADRDRDQRPADPAAARVRGDHGVEHEGMDAAVPRDVDEPDEPVGVARAHPPEAMAADLCLP